MIQPWFSEAKLGIFIHWGSYAVGRRGGESWPLIRGKVSQQDYLKEMAGFTAQAYDPDAWARLFKRAGARYAVLTTKHHDGVTLWPTEQDSPSLADQLDRDLVGAFVESVRRAGIHPGLYFSHTDWSHMPHIAALSGRSVDELKELQKTPTSWIDGIICGEHLSESTPETRAHWESFLTFHRAQIKELLTSYAPIDLIWFDVLWGADRFPYRCAELREFIHDLSPKTVINSRMEGHGDYETPEQFIPVHAPEGPWEFCVTTNDTWSYTGSEQHYKSSFEIIMMFCECLGMGGNMLLNIGPDEHGVIPPEQIKILENLGDWISKHEEAVYPVQRGLPHGYAYHFTSLTADKTILYLYVGHRPATGGTPIKGIRNEIRSATLLGTGQPCPHKRIGGAPWLNVPSTLWFELPEQRADQAVEVVRIELEGTLDLYSGEGVEIDVN